MCAALAGGTGCSTAKAGKGQPATGKRGPEGAVPGGAKPKAIITPVAGLAGRVASVNPAYQFVVIAFEGGSAAVPDQKLAVYRANLKVGEVRVSRQQMGRNVVADIVAGEARAGDEVRAE
jgi:hypothetical protein